MTKVISTDTVPFFSNQQSNFIRQLSIPLSFQPRSSRSMFDTQFILTRNQVWQAKFGGAYFKIDFNELIDCDNDQQKIIKWIMVDLAQRYSFGYIVDMFKNLCIFFKREKTFFFDKCINYLKKILLTPEKQNTNDYYAFKRVLLFLIESEFPGFDYEDEYKLEALPYPSRTDSWKAYYDLDFRLKPDISRYIRNGILTVTSQKEMYSLDQILSVSTLAIVYETGLRTIQMHRLTDKDLSSDGDEFYSLLITRAKSRGLKNKGHYSITLSSEVGGLLAYLVKSRSTLPSKENASDQLLRTSVSEETIDRQQLISLINKGLSVLGGKNIPRLTPYDFRHNIGHSLAMTGASADEIALILGHSSTVVARHYISATPEIAFLKQKALGENRAYLDMMGMIMTGEIIGEDNCLSQKVAGSINNMMITGIGGCTAHLCHFTPIRACYGCSSFNPFKDGNHNDVKVALQSEVKVLMKLSDSTGQTSRNPLIYEHEQTIFEVDSVISLCSKGNEI